MIEIRGEEPTFTRLQRWGHVLTLLVGVVALLYAVNLRSSINLATSVYTNVRAGIAVNYPSNWLLDETGDYVMRIRDMRHIGYKTTIQISTRAISADMTAQNVLDVVNISRSQTLAIYTSLSTETTILPDGTPATAMDYTFADIETNPFLESVPTIVLATDILTIRGGQAIIITFRADADTFEEDYAIFDRFLNSLEFS